MKLDFFLWGASNFIGKIACVYKEIGKMKKQEFLKEGGIDEGLKLGLEGSDGV